ncbi:MAG: hypothetical protein ACOCXA_08240, partial [Planctomycetota bacterium]
DNAWGPQFDFDKHDDTIGCKPSWDHVGNCLRRLIQDFHIDGLRLDAVAQVASHDFLKWLSIRCQEWSGTGHFYLIAEHLPEDPELVKNVAGLEATWNSAFYFTIRDGLMGDWDLLKLQSVLDPRKRGHSDPISVVNYIGTHDTGHMLHDLYEAGIGEQDAFARIRTAFVLLFAGMGIPQIWMGGEFGSSTEKTLEPNPLDWSLLERDGNRDLHAFVHALAQIRREQGALRSPNIAFIMKDDERRLLAWRRWDDQGSVLILLAHLDAGEVDCRLDLDEDDGDWIDVFDGDRQQRDEDDRLHLPIGSWQVRILRKL